MSECFTCKTPDVENGEHVAVLFPLIDENGIERHYCEDCICDAFDDVWDVEADLIKWALIKQYEEG